MLASGGEHYAMKTGEWRNALMPGLLAAADKEGGYQMVLAV